MAGGWTELLCLLCIARFTAGELKQLDRFRYVANFPLTKDVALRCNADLMVQYVPTAAVRWLKGKNEVGEQFDARMRVDDTHTLHIKALEAEDSGVYACVVAFPGGTEVISSEIALSAGDKNQEFVSWLKHKGSPGGARNVWALSAASCVIITLLWVIIILITCKRSGKRAKKSGDAEKEEGGDRESGSDEDGSASESEALIKKKKKEKKKEKKQKKKTSSDEDSSSSESSVVVKKKKKKAKKGKRK
ncbi:tyrosine-protein kinase-like otk isoform X1 [Branchiostoma lanceolatum]|uniref:tyrosine-protein kinase-like otk isoform X1 n=1 Tax=Branchiostoma lanceolatum TaxID=7740 RepID=UPI003452B75D